MLNPGNSHHVAHHGGLAATYQSISDREAAAVANAFYEIEGRVVRLTTEKDDTFRLEDRRGGKYILKIANPAEDASEIDCQIELLNHIERHGPDLPIPRVIPTKSGFLHFQYEDQAGQSRRVRLMSYLEGIPLSEISSSAEIREEVGIILARLRLAMEDFRHAADTRVLAWDVKHLASLRPLLPEIADQGHRKHLEQAFARFAEIEPWIANSRSQVVHNDFSKSNVVIDTRSPSRVSGVIDFGDAVRTSIAIDLSTALLNQLPQRGRANLFAEGHDLLRGYLSVADLTDDELRLTPHLVMARVVARALLTTWRAKMFPENATYILRNTEQGWEQLNWFLSRGIAQISDEFCRDAREGSNLGKGSGR